MNCNCLKYLLSAVILLHAGSTYAGPGKNVPNTAPYIDQSNMDLSVKPGDNFYRYVNGSWLKNNPVPASKTSWGSFLVLREESSQRLRTILEEATRNTGKDRKAQMIGDFYASGMDSLAAQVAGITPVKADLERIAAVSNVSAVLAEIAGLRTVGYGSPLFRMGVAQDRKNVNQYIPQLNQGGTTLPDRDYYLKNDARSVSIRDAYKIYLQQLFSLSGEDANSATASAASVLAIETALAQVQYTRVEQRDPYKTYNKFALKDLNKVTPSVNWNDLFAKMKVRAGDSVLLDNPAFFKTADSMLSSVPLGNWKSYLKWSVLKSSAPYLATPFVDASFRFSQVLSGQKEQTPRWQRVASLIDESIGEMLGQLYVDKYFKPEAKQRMQELVNNLQVTFEERIKRLDWMSEATKKRGIEKLHAFTKKIAYPDTWKEYQGVTIAKNDFIGNIRSAETWAYNDMVERMGKPVDRTRWGNDAAHHQCIL